MPRASRPQSKLLTAVLLTALLTALATAAVMCALYRHPNRASHQQAATMCQPCPVPPAQPQPQPQPQQQQQQQQQSRTHQPTVYEQDHAVLADPLAPPVTRAPIGTNPPFVPQPTDTRGGQGDSFRLVAYLVQQEDRGDTWKLFARERQRRGGLADFYASSANPNHPDVKVPITQDMQAHSPSSDRLRDVYTLPPTITLEHPMFSHLPYTVMALPFDTLS